MPVFATPALDEVLGDGAPVVSTGRRRTVEVPVHPESIVGSDISTPGCPCDREQVVAQVCLDAGGCMRGAL